jgi:hypothetical protein
LGEKVFAFVNKYKIDTNWRANFTKRVLGIQQIYHLVACTEDTDGYKHFDLIVYQLELAILQQSKTSSFY